jgi:hypothetical protein
VVKVYIVSFRTHDDRRPSKFIVLADNMKSAINMAWEHGGADFQSRFDKASTQAQEMKKGGATRFVNLREKDGQLRERFAIKIGGSGGKIRNLRFLVGSHPTTT